MEDDPFEDGADTVLVAHNENSVLTTINASDALRHNALVLAVACKEIAAELLESDEIRHRLQPLDGLGVTEHGTRILCFNPERGARDGPRHPTRYSLRRHPVHSREIHMDVGRLSQFSSIRRAAPPAPRAWHTRGPCPVPSSDSGQRDPDSCIAGKFPPASARTPRPDSHVVLELRQGVPVRRDLAHDVADQAREP